MKDDAYNIRDKKATTNARVATVLTGLLVLLGLFFISFTVTDTEEQTEEGILVNFGTMDVGSGDIQPQQDAEEFAEIEDVQEQQEAVPEPEAIPEPTPSQETEQLTQKEETVKLNEDNEQPRREESQTEKTEEVENVEETTQEPKEKPKPKINERALYPGKQTNNSANEGATGNNGDQGSTEGVPEQGAYEGTSTGIGDSGVGYDLSGRKLITPPSLKDNSNAQGKITVTIKVDQNGNVLSATLGRPTTISSSTLRKKAIQAAKKAKFDRNARAAEEQFGTMTFVFRVR